MLDELIKNAKNVKGNILTLGFANNSKLVQTINNNKKVNNIITLTNKGNSKKNSISEQPQATLVNEEQSKGENEQKDNTNVAEKSEPVQKDPTLQLKNSPHPL